MILTHGLHQMGNLVKQDPFSIKVEKPLGSFKRPALAQHDSVYAKESLAI